MSSTFTYRPGTNTQGERKGNNKHTDLGIAAIPTRGNSGMPQHSNAHRIKKGIPQKLGIICEENNPIFASFGSFPSPC